MSMLAALPVLGGGWMWFRDSSFVAVRTVHISGVRGADGTEIEAALAGAARHMSTLDVHPGALLAAVAPLHLVRAVRAQASFPHGLSIEVSEQLPVAVVELGGIRTAVAADGVVLGPSFVRSTLPSVSAGSSSSQAGELTGQYVRGGTLLGELAVLGAEPAPFAKEVTRVYSGAEGITVVLRNGLLAYFGDAGLPHAKWLSLARVLIDQSSAGATYVDVRVPERPAAGFPAGLAPASASATSGAEAQTAAGLGSATEPTTTAELAEGLAAALGSTTSSGAGTGREAASPTGAQTQSQTDTTTEAGTAGTPAATAAQPSETTSAGSPEEH